jgi:hypothetical protein
VIALRPIFSDVVEQRHPALPGAEVAMKFIAVIENDFVTVALARLVNPPVGQIFEPLQFVE